ncbi:MAG: TetR/AcrR family transcriptional regulator [bacterium]
MSIEAEKERIIEFAMEKFLSTGVSKVTVDDLATELRMSKKTLYKYFPSKEDLIRSIMRLNMKWIEKNADEIFSSDKPVEQKLAAFFMLVGRVMSRVSKQFQGELKTFSPSLWQEIETFRREKIFGRLKKLFAQAKQEGLFREDLSVDFFYLVFSTVVDGMMNPQVIAHQSFSMDEAFRGLYKLMMVGAVQPEARDKFQFMDNVFS